jgi:hypothetical protein
VVLVWHTQNQGEIDASGVATGKRITGGTGSIGYGINLLTRADDRAAARLVVGRSSADHTFARAPGMKVSSCGDLVEILSPTAAASL